MTLFVLQMCNRLHGYFESMPKQIQHVKSGFWLDSQAAIFASFLDMGILPVIFTDFYLKGNPFSNRVPTGKLHLLRKPTLPSHLLLSRIGAAAMSIPTTLWFSTYKSGDSSYSG